MWLIIHKNDKYFIYLRITQKIFFDNFSSLNNKLVRNVEISQSSKNFHPKIYNRILTLGIINLCFLSTILSRISSKNDNSKMTRIWTRRIIMPGKNESNSRSDTVKMRTTRFWHRAWHARLLARHLKYDIFLAGKLVCFTSESRVKGWEIAPCYYILSQLRIAIKDL